LAKEFHPLLGDFVSVLIIYWGLAARDLWDHCSAVFEELQRGDLECARKKVGMICGRDTGELDEEEIARATVESSGENLVDGVIAPIFYAALGGPVAIMAYKAISTLDSTFGYKNENYKDFGWASARLDDIAAHIPARLSGVVVPLSAGILGLNMSGSIRIFLRDRLKHSSPNAGHSEAAFAGALNVQLGGPSHYGGIASMKPFIGDPIERIAMEKVNEANKLMLVSSILFLAMALLARFALYYSIDYLAAFQLNGAIIG
jgi:adenosylcobinamide-phosphate synthase